MISPHSGGATFEALREEFEKERARKNRAAGVRAGVHPDAWADALDDEGIEEDSPASVVERSRESPVKERGQYQPGDMIEDDGPVDLDALSLNVYRRLI